MLIQVPADLTPDVSVTGPGGFEEQLVKTRTLSDLSPGDYVIAAKTIVRRGPIVDEVFDASVSQGSVSIDDDRVQVTVTYARRAGTGKLLVTNGGNKVVSFDVAELQKTGTQGDTRTSLLLPNSAAVTRGLAMDGAGNLWVGTCDNTGHIYRFSPQQIEEGGPQTPEVTLKIFGSLGGNIACCSTLIFDAKGNLFVADFDLLIFMLEPAQLKSGTITPKRKFEPADAWYINGMTFDSGGNLWLASTRENMIASIPRANVAADLDAYETRWFEGRNNPEYIGNPRGLTVGPNGRLWVTTMLPPSIRTFDMSKVDVTPPELEFSAELMTSPLQMIFDASGNLWVANEDPGRVLRFPKSELTNGIRRPDLVLTGGGDLKYADSLTFNPPRPLP